MPSEFLFVSVPNGTDGADNAFRNLMRAGSSTQHPYGELHKVEVPTLLVGTLDALMNLSDDLVKIDQTVESVAKKIERQYVDLDHGASSLTINGSSIVQHIQQFSWDYAKYPHKRPLRDLVQLVTSGVSSIDEEMRTLQGALLEKTQALAEMKRKKGGSMLVADLGDVLTDNVVGRLELHDTEYLKTIFIAVPKSGKDSFMQTYDQIGSDLVDYNGVPGSPVVPNSLRLIREDFESCLFTITILKARYSPGGFEGSEFKPGVSVDLEEQFAKAARERRAVVKAYTPTSGGAGRSTMALEESIAALDSMTANMGRWCKTHYGEVFSAWVHLKVIRVFIESVLRYGLPVNVTCCVFKVNAGKDLNLMKSLCTSFSHLGDDFAGDGDDDDDVAQGEEYLPYASQKLVVE
jgi:V-type H+-transporting ATPase subunit C